MWKPPIGDGPDLDVLHPGVPEWLGRSLRDWMRDLFENDGYLAGAEIELAKEFDLLTRERKPLSNFDQRTGLPDEVFFRGDDFILNFVAFLLHKVWEEVGGCTEIDLIASTLDEAGSEWAVCETPEGPRLLKRVDATVQDNAAETIGSAGSAGDLLAEAWRAMYGRSPDYEEAYENAIKAVEEAATSVVSPENSRATLGTIIRDMKSQRNWGLPIADPPGDANRATILSMAETLWLGHESRHGGNGYRKPTAEEAEAAVTLAVALVHVFTRGLVTRRP